VNRRALLASLGSLAFAGCTTGDGAGTATTTAAPTTERRTTDSPTATDAETPTEPQTTAEPSTPDVGGPPSEAAGPPWDDDVRRVVAWPEADEAPIRLEPPTQHGSLPETRFEFSLTNDTGVRFAFNPYGWSVWKRVDGEWYRLAPAYWPEPLQYLPPGESHTWTVTVDNGRLDGSPLPNVQGTSSLTFAGFGGGTYAFVTDGWFATEDYESGVGFAARFELDGDPVELTPTNEVTATTREGDTVVVETDVDAGGDGRMAAFVVTRVGDAADATENGDEESGDDDDAVRRLVVEQALRDRRLRNTLPLFEDGVETVRLVEPNATTPPFGVGDARRIEYDGVRYRLTAEELGATETEAEGTATATSS
jgi:hypothetical protein